MSKDSADPRIILSLLSPVARLLVGLANTMMLPTTTAIPITCLPFDDHHARMMQTSLPHIP
jgi:hypothetical protein